jgi:agmatine deiminase
MTGADRGRPGPGWRMPAEWEQHAATWIAWPHNRRDWPGKFTPIPFVYAEIVRHLARHERVEVLVQDAGAEAKVRKLLERSGALDAEGGPVRFHRWPTDRIWLRDSGCSFLTGPGGLGAVSWTFNAWAKYPDWQRDRTVGRSMAEAAGARTFQARHDGGPMVLEGGSIEVNGRGTLITTEECLLSRVQERNPGLDRAGYEQAFAQYLGVRRVIWLGRGVQGDDTHGHVDDLARFVAPDTVVAAVEPDPAAPNHGPLADNLRRLRQAADQDDKPLKVVPLPMPAAPVFDGARLPASYANFYLANGLVLVPVFNDRNDRLALNTLAELFPDREVVGVYAGDLILGLGALHCLTQQQPQVEKR